MEDKKEPYCFFPETKDLLEKEIKRLTQAREGVGTAWNVLKSQGVEDEHLRDLYNTFDTKIKDYELGIRALYKESLNSCACC